LLCCRVVGSFVCWFVCWLVGSFVCWFVCLLVCWFVGWFVCSFVGSFVCLFVCWFVCLFVCLLVRLFVRSFVCSFVCLFVCWFVCLLVRSFVGLFVCWFVCFVSDVVCSGRFGSASRSSSVHFRCPGTPSTRVLPSGTAVCLPKPMGSPPHPHRWYDFFAALLDFAGVRGLGAVRGAVRREPLVRTQRDGPPPQSTHPAAGPVPPAAGPVPPRSRASATPQLGVVVLLRQVKYASANCTTLTLVALRDIACGDEVTISCVSAMNDADARDAR
jgi:hypothetical protein